MILKKEQIMNYLSGKKLYELNQELEWDKHEEGIEKENNPNIP